MRTADSGGTVWMLLWLWNSRPLIYLPGGVGEHGKMEHEIYRWIGAALFGILLRGEKSSLASRQNLWFSVLCSYTQLLEHFYGIECASVHWGSSGIWSGCLLGTFLLVVFRASLTGRRHSCVWNIPLSLQPLQLNTGYVEEKGHRWMEMFWGIFACLLRYFFGL